MAEPFLGMIIIFGGNFAPKGWAFCNGQLLPINQNTALFSLLGTTYGGNGTTTFALPDLRGRVPLHFGQGPGLSNYVEGQVGGVENVTLLTSQMPAHTHVQPATAGDETTNRPNEAIPARGGVYASTPDGSNLAATSSAGGGQPHVNLQPYLALNYIIALQGIFPSRN
ncbi:MAG: phage tail protein [Gaiellaceae bacterium]